VFVAGSSDQSGLAGREREGGGGLEFLGGVEGVEEKEKETKLEAFAKEGDEEE
jgi:hypothetical protein